MRDLEGFVFQSHTQEGYPILGCGIAQRPTAGYRIEMTRKAQQWTFAPTDDPFATDRHLAELAGFACPEGVPAIGISIEIPLIAGPTGGIIGSPRIASFPANGRPEIIGHGLSVAAYPGGPGVVVLGTPGHASSVLDLARPGDGGIRTLKRLAAAVSSLGLPLAIMAADGTGTRRGGAVLALNLDRMDCLAMPDVLRDASTRRAGSPP